MAINQNKRQKKLQRKAKKRKQNLIKKTSWSNISKSNAESSAKFPIYECLVPDKLFEMGLGEVILSRKTPQGMIAYSIILLDVFCLGVKDALFKVTDEYFYEEIKSQIIYTHENQILSPTEPACALKLIDGAIDYARNFGFSPHPDFRNAVKLFGSINSDSCAKEFEYGKDGRPFYFQGPHESPSRVKQIISNLREKCGADGFDYILALGDISEL